MIKNNEYEWEDFDADDRDRMIQLQDRARKHIRHEIADLDNILNSKAQRFYEEIKETAVNFREAEYMIKSAGDIGNFPNTGEIVIRAERILQKEIRIAIDNLYTNKRGGWGPQQQFRGHLSDEEDEMQRRMDEKYKQKAKAVARATWEPVADELDDNLEGVADDE